MKLKLYPDKALRVVCKKIKQVKNNHIKHASKMHKIMLDNNGVGLSAPQVGLDICLIVINTLKENGIKRTMFNPEIIEKSEEIYNFKEGCLSFPGKFIDSGRSNKIKVKYINSQNIEIVEEFVGLTSVCIQHEIDHLHGKLFIDNLLEKV